MGVCLFSGCNDSDEIYGELYDLKEAYEAGWLTKEDLMSIAYYHNGGREGNEDLMAEDFEPIPKTPLSEETESAIKETAANDLRNDKKSPIPDADASKFVILEYCGTYGNCYAVRLNSPYFEFPAVIIDEWVDIGGVVRIHYKSHTLIEIWKQN